MTKRFLTPISTDHVDFNLSNNFANAKGRLKWNNTDNSLDLGMSADSVQSIGVTFYTPPTKNASGASIAKGSFVMATGAIGDKITIAKAVTNGSINPSYMLGIADNTINNDAEDGIIVTNGVVKGINTAIWSEGTILYANPSVAGGLTSTKPTAPSLRTPVAMVLRQHASTGQIYVKITPSSILGDTDSNVDFDNPQAGDVIVYDGVENIWTNGSAPPAVVPTGAILPENSTNGLFFYNTTSDKLYFFFNQWKEILWNEITSLDGGTSSTTEFDIQIDNGNSSTLIFAGAYDNGNSATQF